MLNHPLPLRVSHNIWMTLHDKNKDVCFCARGAMVHSIILLLSLMRFMSSTVVKKVEGGGGLRLKRGGGVKTSFFRFHLCSACHHSELVQTFGTWTKFPLTQILMNSKKQTFSLFKLAVLILDSLLTLVDVVVFKMMTYFVTMKKISS